MGSHDADTGGDGALFLGIDAGTQSIKASIYDGGLKLIKEFSVKFDKELPQYGTNAGMIVEDEAAGVVRSPVLMWFEALDMALEGVSEAVDLSRVVAISGSAQQHSSVWWRSFPSKFDAGKRLVDQLRDENSFATEMSPIWADSSTSEEVKFANDKVGGPASMQVLTGSVGTERFTGNQIARMVKHYPEVYDASKHIMLLSTALSSIFLGKPAPTEAGDAAGMNMMELDRDCWLTNLEEVFDAPGLTKKVGEICEANANLGPVSDYMVQRYNFSPACCVAAFTGDNLATLIGCVDQADDVIVSLGTSDTVLSQQPTRQGVNQAASVFPHPTDSDLYMVMICYKNGGAVRSACKGEEHSWDEFDDALLSAEDPDDPDVLFINFPQREIAPRPIGPCAHAFLAKNSQEVDPDSLSWRQRIRGLILARAVSIMTHLEDCNASYKRIIMTGGGSNSKGIQAVFRQVLGVTVVASQEADSASRGAALKAMLSVNQPPKSAQAAMSERDECSEFVSIPSTQTYRNIEADL
mmetsp:Transcript_17563/g.34535  ORF Transcript_17563/g.34535 Transcript_17563/m.34535 type:complete len:524 (-) Transcript_17563:246-1817(-)|eukprot:CAMPEP_0171493610 /NCGR_PEP_ID=MMETSP0958-20121227/5058_1 /TAXON_ID=87120 /ORGANISM="Aurantiochytrium limacinum, Strain ATCCMYA-1381" /LENGTH=523 /DNA_ID=CAMNT_0012027253 /DNA_START=65 /DNA_END=1636 /DNA_ORIENTATION=+